MIKNEVISKILGYKNPKYYEYSKVKPQIEEIIRLVSTELEKEYSNKLSNIRKNILSTIEKELK